MSQHLQADIPKILQKLHSSNGAVLALDFDGTLAPIVDRPERAAMPFETAALLRKLTASKQISLVVLSGRSMADLKSRVAVDCILAANHGLEIAGKGIAFVHQSAADLRVAIECAFYDLATALEGLSGVLIEDKGLTATVHYRRVPSDLTGWIAATVHAAIRPYAPCLDLKPARKAWEIRPRVDWNKGDALDFVVRCAGLVEPLVICAGDDITDEDMFRMFPDAVSIQVGARSPTAARYHVSGPGELASFLRELAAGGRAGEETSWADDTPDQALLHGPR